MLWRWSGLAVLVLAAGANSLDATMPFFKRTAPPAPVFAIPIQELAGPQDKIRFVVQNPTLSIQGPVERFACNPDHYHWFVEHPDLAVLAWRQLGAKCVAINDLGSGQFGWADDLGSTVTWQTVFRDAGRRVWYAHGNVRPGLMLPMVPVEVVLVLHHREYESNQGKKVVEHYSDLYLYTDSKTATVFARIMGTSTHRLAEQGLHQLQLFFSALSWYIDQHPQRAESLLGKTGG
jgi:hypothetical protein